MKADPSRVAARFLVATDDPMATLLKSVRDLIQFNQGGVGTEAKVLAGRAREAREALQAQVPTRVRKWNSPEGESVGKMKGRVEQIRDLENRLTDLAEIFEALEDVVFRLE